MKISAKKNKITSILDKLCLFLILSILFSNCTGNKKSNEVTISIENEHQVALPKADIFYHYSIWYAFVNKIFEGDINAKELKTKGDIGLGSYNFLDGELIMLNGTLYQATEDGKVHIANDSTKIAYANATFFDTDKSFKIASVPNYDFLREQINKELPTKNIFYGFKIYGHFKKITCGGLHKQDKPFEKGLDILIPNRPIFEREDVEGTMVGFFCPEFIGNINVAGYHLHFVSDDEQFAGHVMEFEAKNLTVELDYIYEYTFVLPQTKEYMQVGFENEFQYKKK